MGLRTAAFSARTTRRIGAPPTGRRLHDRFELLVPLGSGGFGVVWEGFDMLLERSVAIKELVVDDDDVTDALREARATARLNHPAIVSIYEVIGEGDRIYMINELVHGHTLGEMISAGELSDNDIGRIGYGLCEALAHAHNQGVMHRDVKPANVMVTTDWLEGSGGWRVQPAKLMDFGIASIIDGGDFGHGPHAGSRGYMAPEQIAGEEATPESDVYSLALVLFECLTGALPGRGKKARLTRARRDLPYDLTCTIDRCLEEDPWLRPDVVDLGQALRAALPELSHQLSAPRTTRRLRSLFSRGAATSERAPAPRRAPADELHETGSGRLWRFGLAALAAGICAVTMLAAGLEISFVQPLVAAAIVFLLPRAGWALAATAGATALAIDGEVGSAMFMVLPAAVAAFAAMTPLPRVFDGALAGAGAFAWVVGVQVLSGTSLAISLPTEIDDPEAIRRYADVALHSLSTLAAPAYTASLGLWSLTGSAVVLMIDRRAGLLSWIALGAAALAAQVAIGASLRAPVPALTIVAGVLLLIALAGAAAMTRRTDNVFAPREQA